MVLFFHLNSGVGTGEARSPSARIQDPLAARARPLKIKKEGNYTCQRSKELRTRMPEKADDGVQSELVPMMVRTIAVLQALRRKVPLCFHSAMNCCCKGERRISAVWRGPDPINRLTMTPKRLLARVLVEAQPAID